MTATNPKPESHRKSDRGPVDDGDLIEVIRPDGSVPIEPDPDAGAEPERAEAQAAVADSEASVRLAVASPRQMMWRRFKRHRLAMVSLIVLGLFYFVAVFGQFVAPYDPNRNIMSNDLEFNTAAKFVPPTLFSFRNADGDLTLRPHAPGLRQHRDPETLRLTYSSDQSKNVPISLFVKGHEYRLLGLVTTDRHLFGIDEARHPDAVFMPLGSDRLGRDMFSRVVYGTRISLSIGMLSVVASLVLGVILGGISGYYGGWIDGLIQRVIEFLVSIPSIPLWMGLSAAMPPGLSNTTRYFLLTIILSVIGWTTLARVVRGRFLTLRDEDFVMAARFSGASEMRIILRHMTPAMTSHIIAELTLAIPGVILAETGLSFLGLGLRDPTISWGVLIQEAQNIRTVSLAPWLLLPGLAVVISVLAFNFLGDGLRDAADPYSTH
jgi:peptide/nickel transport system permease protein